MKTNFETKQPRFFYWIWSPFHVIVFVLLTMLFFTPAIFLVAGTDWLIENALFKLPPPATSGPLSLWGFLSASLVAIPIAALLAQATCYVSSMIRIQWETEVGHRLAVVIAGVLIVLALAHKLPGDDFPLGASPAIASFFAGVALVLLNVVALVLRKLTGREVIFRHMEELESRLHEKAAAPKKRPKKRRK